MAMTKHSQSVSHFRDDQ